MSRNLKIEKLREVIDETAVTGDFSDPTLGRESFVYRPPVSSSKLLKADDEDIRRILGISWDQALFFSVTQELTPLFSKLDNVSELGFNRTFFVSGNRWKNETKSVFRIPETDVLIITTDYGFICRRRDWDRIKSFVESISLSPSNYNTAALDKVFWDAKTESLKRDILFFSKSKHWFDKRDLPYSRSYLLYGPPGNGKTSTIRAVSNFFHTTPSQFSFTGRYEDPDTEFLNWVGGTFESRREDDYDDGPLFSHRGRRPSIEDEQEENPRIRILLLEDIDRFFSKEEGFKTPVSFSAILNALDGVAQRKNSILIATANNPEKIDSQVLFRPGRFDLRIPFDAPNSDGIASFLRKLAEDDAVSESMIQKVSDAAKGHSLAFVKGVYLAAANKAFARASEEIHDDDIEVSLQEFLSNLGRDIKSNRPGTGF